MYADDLAIIAESKQDLQEVLEEWKRVFEKHGLRMSPEKTEVIWVGHQRGELNIRLDDQASGWLCVSWRNGYGGWAFSGTAEVRRRTQAGANAWRKVEGVMFDRKIKKTEREIPENMCYTSMPVWYGGSGVDRTTTTEAASVWE